MAMRRGERITLCALVAVVVVGALGWFASEGISGIQYEQLVEQTSETHQVGEVISLCAEDDAADIAGGQAYSAGFLWSGTLEVSVDSVVVYDCPESIGVDSERAHFVKSAESDSPGREDAAFVVCEVTVRNVDAAPAFLTTGEENWFNVSFVNLSFPYAPLTYFSGAPEGASASDLFCFDLAPGQTATYQLGYTYQNSLQTMTELDQALADQAFVVQFGTSDKKGKYQVTACAEDRRTQEWLDNLPEPTDFSDDSSHVEDVTS